MQVPMCKLHVVAASRSNLRQWMLVPGPFDLHNYINTTAKILNIVNINMNCSSLVISNKYLVFIISWCGKFGGSG